MDSRRRTLARFGFCALLLVSCTFPGSVKPTLKIGLSGPFEGLYRELGYSVLHAVRLAVRQRNESGGIRGRYLLELVALNDFNEPAEAKRQAAEMDVDPGVLAVLGGWSPATEREAAPEYSRRGLAFVAPSTDWTYLGRVAAQVAVDELGAHRAVILQASGTENLALVDGFIREFTVLSGEVAAKGTPSAQGDVRRLVTGSGEGPVLVFLAADPPTSAGWLSEIREAAPDVFVLGGPALGCPLVATIAGQDAERVRFVSHLGPPPSEIGFVKGYETLSGGVSPGPAAGWAYEAALRLLDAMDEAVRVEGRATRDGVRDALGGQPVPDTRAYVYRIEHGQIELTGSR